MVDTDFWGEGEEAGARRRGSEVTAVDLPVQSERSTRRQRRTRRRGGAAVAAALIFLLVLVGGGGYYGYTRLDGLMNPPDYSGEGTGRVTIEVSLGDYTTDVGQTLQKADVVKSVKAFTEAAGVKLQELQPGFYEMRRRMSAQAAVALLLDPKARIGVVDISPGKWSSEIYAQLSKATGIPVGRFKKVDPRTLGLPASAKGGVEGYLYPGRYDLPPDATAEQLLKMMVSRFKEETRDIPFDKGAKAGFTPAEILTVASLIEAEAGRPEDYRKISRVIYNRLDIDMMIQFDTALLYAWQKRTLDVRERHQAIDSPYNLYINRGLPPGPIGNPGVAAIEAALNPAKGKWLYFVATNPTERLTEYAVSYEDFLKLKAKFEKWLKANPQPKS